MNDHNDRFQSRYAITVLKFGSSVLCGADGVEAIVQEVYRAVRQGQRVLAVVSAFPGATDGLLNMAHELFDNPEPTALARLVATGETTSAALLGPDRVSARKRRPEPLRVAILGLGTVGLGVYRRLVSETERFRIVGVGVRDRVRELRHVEGVGVCGEEERQDSDQHEGAAKEREGQELHRRVLFAAAAPD